MVKWLKYATFVILSLVMITAFAMSAVAESYVCEDRDGGEDFNRRTEVIWRINGEKAYAFEDTCSYTDGYLKERVCDTDGQDFSKTVMHRCESGMCANGRCVNTPTQNEEPEPLCIDRDGGQNYYEYGITEVMDNAGGFRTYYDHCDASGLLVETYCGGEGNLVPHSRTYNCAQEGKVCEAGRCVAEEPQEVGCYDSDGGRDFFTKGTTTGIDPYNPNEMRTETDRCSSDTRIIEFECKQNGEITWNGYQCPIGMPYCEDGRCVEEEEQPPSNFCSDSDGGYNYEVKGFIKWDYNGQRGVDYDECQGDGVTLNELYCTANNGPGVHAHDCSSEGKICEAGRCVDAACPHGGYPLEDGSCGQCLTDEHCVELYTEGYFCYKGSCAPPAEEGPVYEEVKCVFTGPGSAQPQECESEKGSCTSHVYEDHGTCVVQVQGVYREQVTWKSSCGGYAYTTIDGNNEYAEFYCEENIEPQPWYSSTLNIRAHIDGRSHLVIQGNSVRWHHYEWAAPGRHLFEKNPTYLNKVKWYPSWPDIPDEENRDCNCDSSREKIKPTLPSFNQKVRMQVVKARENVKIVQHPSKSNGHRLIIEFDDFYTDGSDWYEINLNYKTGEYVPENIPQPEKPKKVKLNEPFKLTAKQSARVINYRNMMITLYEVMQMDCDGEEDCHGEDVAVVRVSIPSSTVGTAITKVTPGSIGVVTQSGIARNLTVQPHDKEAMKLIEYKKIRSKPSVELNRIKEGGRLLIYGAEIHVKDIRGDTVTFVVKAEKPEHTAVVQEEYVQEEAETYRECQNSCYSNGKCVPYGIRLVLNHNKPRIPVYCDISGQLLKQNPEGASCQNNYECLSNTCSNGKCIDLSKQIQEGTNMIEKIWDWLRKIF